MSRCKETIAIKSGVYTFPRLQVSSRCLVDLDGGKQRFEVTSSESLMNAEEEKEKRETNE